MTTFPDFSDLIGHDLDDLDGNGLTHRQWLAAAGAVLNAVGQTLVIANDEDVNVAANPGTTIVIYTALSAARVINLPPASSTPMVVILHDGNYNANETLTITAVPAGSDTSPDSLAVEWPGGELMLANDGVSAWYDISNVSAGTNGVLSDLDTLNDNFEVAFFKFRYPNPYWGTYDAGSGYSPGDCVVGSNNHAYRAEESIDVGDDPVSSTSGRWADISSGGDGTPMLFRSKAGGGIAPTTALGGPENFDAPIGSLYLYNDANSDSGIGSLHQKVGGHADAWRQVGADRATNFRGQYDTTVTYVRGDVVQQFFGGLGHDILYVALRTNTNVDPLGDIEGSPGVRSWMLVGYPVDDWGIGTSYSEGNKVLAGGDVYISLTNVNVGNDPTTDTVNWQPINFDAVLTSPFTFDNYRLYHFGELTLDSAGSIYIASDETIPGTTPADNPNNWHLLTHGGSPVVRRFSFAYNTADILTGAALYTPTQDDVLLDAWIEVVTAWDGTTPFCDVGTFVGANYGIFAQLADAPIDLTQADAIFSGIGLKVGENMSSARDMQTMRNIVQGLTTHAGANPTSVQFDQSSLGSFIRLLPARIPDATPIKVCVSQDGTNTGSDPGSTRGAAYLYLVTATPGS